MHILIAYATCTGTTQKIAEHISGRLSTRRTSLPITTVVHSVSSPKLINPSKPTPESYNDIELETFDAIIIGSAIHSQKWMPEAETLLTKVQREVSVANVETGKSKPVFAFSVGAPNAMPLAVGGMLGRAEEKSLTLELKRKLGGVLRGHKLFYGLWTREALGKGLRARIWTGLWSCFGGKFGDFTDFGIVDAWVDEVMLTEFGMEGDNKVSTARA